MRSGRWRDPIYIVSFRPLSDVPKEKQSTLVYLPGYNRDTDSFAAIFKAQPEFRDHGIIAVNPRGYNGSTNNVSVFSHKENAQDVKVLLDKIGVTKNPKQYWQWGFPRLERSPHGWLSQYPETNQAAFLLNSIPLNGVVADFTKEGLPTNESVRTLEHVQNFMPILDSMLGYNKSDENAFADTFHATWYLVFFHTPPQSTLQG
mmetsp:Transcript_21257/g.34199  ORF Transcript_21257/g.34199 Transcript_21257/m.34199 type:complete len:203 (-) Transcript_21257:748-1356(-)